MSQDQTVRVTEEFSVINDGNLLSNIGVSDNIEFSDIITSLISEFSDRFTSLILEFSDDIGIFL
jgi:hypothetical protein